MPIKRPNIPVIVILGPTAAGKTLLALRLAKKIGAEIISADSMQVYKSMPVLTQAPSQRERKSVRHHLVNLLIPSQEYSAASFSRRARREIDSIIRKGKVPLVVGGSGLYIKALIDGLFRSPRADEKFRASMRGYAVKHGNEKLHKRLEAIDPDSASRIHPNDIKRLIRALELHHSTGSTMSQLKFGTTGIADKYRVKMFGLKFSSRPRLYSAINHRTDKILKTGAVDEVKYLKKRKLSKTAAAVLGFKEIGDYIDGKYGLEKAGEILKRKTRRFAKRQMAWFKPDKRIKWFNVDKVSQRNIVNNIVKGIGLEG